MKRYFVFAVFMFVAFSCSRTLKHSNVEYSPPEYGSTRKATITPVSRDLLFGGVVNMFLRDSVVVFVTKSVDNDNYLQAVSVNDGRFIRGFANTGRGEGEVLNYRNADMTHDGAYIHVLDNANKFVRIDLAKALASETAVAVDSYSFAGHNTTTYAYCLDNSTMLHVEGLPARHFVTDLYFADTLARNDGYPFVSRYLAGNPDTLATRNYFTYNSRVAVKPDATKFVSTANFGLFIEVFDIDGGQIVNSASCRFHEPEMKNEMMAAENCMRGPIEVYATDRYFYVVYCVSPQLSAGSLRMGVFDWTGRAVTCYEFDESVLQIAVTPDDSRVYCWVQDAGDEEYFGYFDLSPE